MPRGPGNSTPDGVTHVDLGMGVPGPRGMVPRGSFSSLVPIVLVPGTQGRQVRVADPDEVSIGFTVSPQPIDLSVDLVVHPTSPGVSVPPKPGPSVWDHILEED